MSESASPRFLDFNQCLDFLRQAVEHLSATAAKMEVCWNPNESDPRKLHNLYARNLFTCYVAKFADLSSSIIWAIETENFLTYALCGRSLIENVATLHYYLMHKYKPLLDRSSISSADMKTLIDLDDQHLRGSRFDWESFFTKDYSKLCEESIRQTQAKKKDQTKKGQSASQSPAQPSAVNVMTCIDKWAAEDPGVRVVYDLFCDMVHPNIGSSFLVASLGPGGLYFAKHKGESLGMQICEQSLPLLLSATHKPFGTCLTMLTGTIWHEDELGA